MSSLPQKINMAEKFRLFADQWSPKIVAELNDFYVKLVKVKGEFVWHKHDEEDEMFYVVAGRMTVKFRNGEATLGPGEMIVVARGVEHKPVADAEAHVMIIERRTTVNTGDAESERTVTELERI